MTLDEQQERDWSILHDRLTAVLDQFGRKDAFGEGDYWLVDDNWGWMEHQVEIQNLNLIKPDVIHALQRALKGFPDWSVSVALAIPGPGEKWPGMGLIVYNDEIEDDLQRDFLPEEFRNIQYEGKVKLGFSRLSRLAT